MKHFQHASKTLAKILEKHFKTYATFISNTCNIYVKHMEHLNKNACNIRLEKIGETSGIEACNIRVQLLQHMQYPDPLLQHLYKTLATYL
jgi:uncharacterized membrane-anchored protein YhcB (DUF1043 family)